MALAIEIKTDDVGASPYPPSGEITIQGEIHPPVREIMNGGPDRRKITEHDYVVYNRCPVFTTAKE